MGLVGWVFGAAAVVVAALGLINYRVTRLNDDRRTTAILSFIIGADLVVLAVAVSFA